MDGWIFYRETLLGDRITQMLVGSVKLQRGNMSEVR